MTKTVIFHNVPDSQLATVVGDLEADGFNVSTQREDDGEYTVIGTKEVPEAPVSAAAAKPPKAAKSGGKSTKKSKSTK